MTQHILLIPVNFPPISVNQKYHTVTAQHVGIANFLQRVNGQKLIDLLIMDIEGAEFGVLPTLIGQF
jgi:hypothetical protein